MITSTFGCLNTTNGTTTVRATTRVTMTATTWRRESHLATRLRGLTDSTERKLFDYQPESKYIDRRSPDREYSDHRPLTVDLSIEDHQTVTPRF